MTHLILYDRRMRKEGVFYYVFKKIMDYHDCNLYRNFYFIGGDDFIQLYGGGYPKVCVHFHMGWMHFSSEGNCGKTMNHHYSYCGFLLGVV